MGAYSSRHEVYLACNLWASKVKQLISSDEAVVGKVQHTKPCSDCPFSRKALNGWLGGADVTSWLATACGDFPEPCHTIKNMQCAGLSIFRSNIAKSPRDPACLKLPADRGTVFAWPDEFRKHHESAPRKK